MAGNNLMLIKRLSTVTVFQIKTWNGNLNKLVMKNSQAAVPTNSFLGKRMAKKKILVNAPAKFPIMVQIPAKTPMEPEKNQ